MHFNFLQLYTAKIPSFRAKSTKEMHSQLCLSSNSIQYPFFHKNLKKLRNLSKHESKKAKNTNSEQKKLFFMIRMCSNYSPQYTYQFKTPQTHFLLSYSKNRQGGQIPPPPLPGMSCPNRLPGMGLKAIFYFEKYFVKGITNANPQALT